MVHKILRKKILIVLVLHVENENFCSFEANESQVLACVIEKLCAFFRLRRLKKRNTITINESNERGRYGRRIVNNCLNCFYFCEFVNKRAGLSLPLACYSANSQYLWWKTRWNIKIHRPKNFSKVFTFCFSVI